MATAPRTVVLAMMNALFALICLRHGLLYFPNMEVCNFFRDQYHIQQDEHECHSDR